eukprot:6054281-Prymnesium_polylepis.1
MDAVRAQRPLLVQIPGFAGRECVHVWRPDHSPHAGERARRGAECGERRRAVSAGVILRSGFPAP